MQTFRTTDAAGQPRDWRLKITIGAVERVEEEVPGKPDLLDLSGGEPSLAARLETDPALLCHVIYALVKPQAEGMDDQGFCELIDAESFVAAAKAFWQELTDFFQTCGRPDLCRLIEAQHQVRTATVEKNIAQVAHNLTKALGPPSGSSLEPADSNPGLSPSAN